MIDEIRKAIHERKLIRFNYTGDSVSGFREVEPYQIAFTRANHLALSAWFLSGASESGSGAGWRSYLLSEIDSLTVLEEHFEGTRPNYKPGTNKIYHNIQCEIGPSNELII
ncbi:MAG TPA: WYL domain-containing protein [Candidatus Saccharimonadales bacterium]|jgi:predicted DNA-binding transcriptional regulator YafY|nr:WYL domain-containing protein [Candidatus Saccharimonadales bacterium]